MVEELELRLANKSERREKNQGRKVHNSPEASEISDHNKKILPFLCPEDGLRSTGERLAPHPGLES